MTEDEKKKKKSKRKKQKDKKDKKVCLSIPALLGLIKGSSKKYGGDGSCGSRNPQRGLGIGPTSYYSYRQPTPLSRDPIPIIPQGQDLEQKINNLNTQLSSKLNSQGTEYKRAVDLMASKILEEQKKLLLESETKVLSETEKKISETESRWGSSRDVEDDDVKSQSSFTGFSEFPPQYKQTSMDAFIKIGVPDNPSQLKQVYTTGKTGQLEAIPEYSPPIGPMTGNKPQTAQEEALKTIEMVKTAMAGGKKPRGRPPLSEEEKERRRQASEEKKKEKKPPGRPPKAQDIDALFKKIGEEAQKEVKKITIKRKNKTTDDDVD